MPNHFFILSILRIAMPLISVGALAAVPLQINHQGVVQVSGAPFTGTGQFRFAIVENGGGTNLWTNDGTEIGTSGTPTAAVSISVTNGLYSVSLGDTSLTNMTALTAGLFSTPGVALRVWFNDGTNGNLQLSPDHLLSSVPYAFQAANAGHSTEADHAAAADTSTTALSASGSVPSGFMILGATLTAPPGFTFTGRRADVYGGEWRRREDIPVASSDFAIGAFNGNIHIVSPAGNHRVYRPATNTWGELTGITTARDRAGGAFVDGKFYVIGGRVGVIAHQENEMYNPESFNWTPKENLPTGRYGFAIGVLGGKIHCVGGYYFDENAQEEKFTRIHEVYDPIANSWTTAAALPNDLFIISLAFQGVTAGGKLYAFVGPTPVEYDPMTDTWTAKRPLPELNQYDATVAEVSGRIFLFGGFDYYLNLLSRDASEYDPSIDTWTKQIIPPSLRRYAGAATVDGKIYLIGGVNTIPSDVVTNEEFTPSEPLYVHRKD
jgi:hypothetical protein